MVSMEEFGSRGSLFENRTLPTETLYTFTVSNFYT
jgi:hypothetical protein